MTELEINNFCRRYNIRDYTINTDGSIDVDGDVNLNEYGLTELPLKFNKVSGSFYCYDNALTSLEDCPSSVGGSFDYADNLLTTLKGSPHTVGKSFDCGNNQLYDLTGIPDSIGEYFYCEGNPIGSIFNEVRQDFLEAFKIYKVIKDGQVNLKRLKYVMSLFNESIDLEEIKKHYTIL